MVAPTIIDYMLITKGMFSFVGEYWLLEII